MESWIHDNLTGAEVIAVSQTGYTNESMLTLGLITLLSMLVLAQQQLAYSTSRWSSNTLQR